MNPAPLMRALITGIALLFGSAFALADEEAGLVTMIQGAVQITRQGQAFPLRQFQKLRTGIEVETGKDGRFQVVYFSSGRQETWSEGSRFLIGVASSQNLQSANPPMVKQLPEVILKGLSLAPQMVSSLHSRQGMIRVRAMPDYEKYEEARREYEKLRGESSDDDLTPELYLLASLEQLKLFSKMKAPLEEMLKRHPDKEEVQSLYAGYRELFERPGAGKQ